MAYLPGLIKGVSAPYLLAIAAIFFESVVQIILFIFLGEIKRDMDYEAETKILQATDEVMNSEEMAQIAQQQAYIDLQNSYNQATNDSAERVGALANLATDI